MEVRARQYVLPLGESKVSSLSEKTSNNTDSNAAKTVALDHLGVIAARLTTSNLKFKNARGDEEGPLRNLDEVSGSSWLC